MEVRSKVLEAQQEMEESLQKLSEFSAPPAFSIQYLYLVIEVMKLYDQFGDAVLENDFESALVFADQVVNKIDYESKRGILTKS